LTARDYNFLSHTGFGTWAHPIDPKICKWDIFGFRPVQALKRTIESNPVVSNKLRIWVAYRNASPQYLRLKLAECNIYLTISKIMAIALSAIPFC